MFAFFGEILMLIYIISFNSIQFNSFLYLHTVTKNSHILTINVYNNVCNHLSCIFLLLNDSH